MSKYLPPMQRKIMSFTFYDSTPNSCSSFQKIFKTESVETKKIPRIACKHRTEDQVITESDEIVCKSCGVVLGINDVSETSTDSAVNLFQEIQPGCKPVKIEATTRIHEQKLAVSSFSNACSKLKLARHVALDAWNMYSKLDKNTSFSTAEKASFALFVACRRYSIPKSDIEIQKSIKFAFSLNRMPTMFKVFSLVKITAKEKLKIKCDGDNHLNYYLNIYSNKAPQQKRDEVRNMIRGLSTLKNKTALENHHTVARFVYNMASRESKEFVKIRDCVLANENKDRHQKMKKKKTEECN
jgi:transcription initiation factor TFIIIB Brf1 subunit/transcription initiation factor TFIIB